MKLQIVSTMVACLVVAPWAAAGETEQEQPWNRHNGFYAEANFGIGFAYFGVVTAETAPTAAGADGFAWVGALGYRFTSHHAIEGGFGQWYTTFNDENDEDDFLDENGDLQERDDERNKEVDTHLNAAYLAW